MEQGNPPKRPSTHYDTTVKTEGKDYRKNNDIRNSTSKLVSIGQGEQSKQERKEKTHNVTTHLPNKRNNKQKGNAN